MHPWASCLACDVNWSLAESLVSPVLYCIVVGTSIDIVRIGDVMWPVPRSDFGEWSTTRLT